MMSTDEREAAEYVNFDDFWHAVGAGEYAVRKALTWLHLEPIKHGRKLDYPTEWIEQVRAIIAEKGW